MKLMNPSESCDVHVLHPLVMSSFANKWKASQKAHS